MTDAETVARVRRNLPQGWRLAAEDAVPLLVPPEGGGRRLTAPAWRRLLAMAEDMEARLAEFRAHLDRWSPPGDTAEPPARPRVQAMIDDIEEEYP